MALPASDLFSGAAGAVSASWTQQTTFNATLTGSGALSQAAASGGEGFVYWNADTFSADQYSQCSLSVLAGGLFYLGVRGSGTEAAVTAKRYHLAARATSTSLEKRTGGVTSTLASLSATIVPGDLVRIAVVGTAITVYKNGTSIGTATDSAISTGTPGVGAQWSSGTTPDAAVDWWEGSDVPTSPGYQRIARNGGGLVLRNGAGGTQTNASDAASGTVSSVAASDTLAADDSETAALVAVGLLGESGTVADISTAAVAAVGSAAESLTAADSVAAQMVASGALTEALSAAEASTGTLATPGALVDTLAVVEASVGSLAAGGAASDGLAAADSAIGGLSLSGSVADTLSAVESSSAVLTEPGATVDTLAAVEAATGALLTSAARTEALAAAETEIST
ncbi:MAG: hypothetical protein H0X39_13045, partial [Actinobacteria bacterium]|nr:hypothetical protein [Actinomycetota bacterium]